MSFGFDTTFVYECVISKPLAIKDHQGYTNKEYEEMTVKVPSLLDCRDGFWLNHNLQFTRISDALFWIPPSRIQCVRKRPV